MHIPIRLVLLLVFISVILSPSNEENNTYYRIPNTDVVFYSWCWDRSTFRCDYFHPSCKNEKCKNYERANTIRQSNWQTTHLNDPLQCYFFCTKVYSSGKYNVHLQKFYRLEFVEDCSIPNVSFAEIINAGGDQELMNDIRFKSFSNNDIILQSYHFKNLSHLNKLYIERNTTKIDELPHDIFEEISVLNELSLNNVSITVQLLKPLARLIVKLELAFNNLTTLNDNIFLNFSKMKFLSIKGNNFHNISKFVFNSTRELIQLDLIDNNIEYLEIGAFGNLRRLQHLNLSYNSLTKLPRTLLANAAELVNISIDANKLTELDWKIFHYCNKIKFLSLKNNFLKSIPNNIFISNKDIEELDISDNQLQELNVNHFRMKHLRKLRLARNHLKQLFVNFFPISGKLKSLVELDVSHNYLKTAFDANFLMGDRSVNFMNNVEVINFRNNSLDESIYWINPHWVNLRTVDLSYNKFNCISEEYFISRSKVDRIFNFTNNPIRNIEFNRVQERIKQADCHKSSSCGIVNIILEYNSVECNCNVFGWAKHIQAKSHLLVKNHIHHQSSDQPSCQWSNSKKTIPLKDLDLQAITCPVLEENGHLVIYDEIPADFDIAKSPGKCDYQYRPAIDSIIVNCSNQIYNLQLLNQYDLVKEINKSVELILTNNNIVFLSQISILSSIPSLIKLSLSSNLLRNIDELHIPNTLAILELDNNEISHLNDVVIGRMNESDNLTFITLHNNPWECSCKTEKMMKFFQLIQKKIMYQDKVICNETGESIFHVSTNYLCQEFFYKYLPLISALILAALAFAVTLIVLLSYIYKNEIKVWMFANKYLSWLVTEQEIDKDKEYDAFISFSSKDTHFVENELLPELEKNNKHPPLKLCVHYRNFIVGEHIPTQIDHFVKNSRRTVILLSSNFLKSEWAKIEFSTAHLESIRENRPKVITILLEEINKEDLDHDLKKYISLYTYLKWGEPFFWERLRFALPHPQPTVVSTDLHPV